MAFSTTACPKGIRPSLAIWQSIPGLLSRLFFQQPAKWQNINLIPEGVSIRHGHTGGMALIIFQNRFIFPETMSTGANINEIIRWLQRVEAAAADAYGRGAEIFSHDSDFANLLKKT